MTARKPHPPCPICGHPVDRREGESPNNYHRRRYCRSRCEREGRSLSAAAGLPRYLPGWPVITDPGERLSGQCYAPYEVRVRPRPGRVDQPATVLPSGTALGGEG